jgi:uncharacterized radical SAM superfamily Fe-S cluster-containing enzyme
MVDADNTPATSPGEQLDAYRLTMRRFEEHFAALPVDMQVTCPKCNQVVPGQLQKSGEQVVLETRCPTCGTLREVHHDAIYTPLVSDHPNSPSETYGGSRIRPVIRRLPRTVETLCPECAAVIVGRYFVQDGGVMMEKTCPEHGYFRDRINTDAALFSKSSWWSFEEHAGLQEPHVTDAKNCPTDCGLCNQHLSSPVLAQIDLTNRCNMRCPICFANAGAQGFTWEPDYDEIVRQMQVLRDMKPHPTTALQFTGGEPTIHPRFLDLVRKANEMGFSHLQIATNGITLADPEFAKQAYDAGLHTLYLQFDGIGDEPYQEIRAYKGIWEKKLACIENCRALDIKVCLVPTILKTVNDDQVPKILQFAVDNVDVVSGISWQPVSFTGRIDQKEIEHKRYTLGDLAHDLGSYPGIEAARDMYPLSVTVPLSNLLEAITGQPKIRASAHPDCAFGTYLLVSPEGKVYPFPAVLDVGGMFSEFNRHAARIKARGGKANWLDKLRLVKLILQLWKKETAPPDLTVWKFIRTILGMVDKRVGRGDSGKKNYRTILCAGMHFQDRWNYDVERTKRCVILYSTPAGVFPFCTHNCGPEFRHLSQAAFLEETK